jgi:hypothetical protein
MDTKLRAMWVLWLGLFLGLNGCPEGGTSSGWYPKLPVPDAVLPDITVDGIPSWDEWGEDRTDPADVWVPDVLVTDHIGPDGVRPDVPEQDYIRPDGWIPEVPPGDTTIRCKSDEDCGPEQWCSRSFGMCLPWVCVPGQPGCIGDTGVSCASNGSGWVPGDVCPVGTVCLEGECVKDLYCQPGQKKCQGNGVVQCQPDGQSWSAVQPCPDGTTCNPATGECVTGCVPQCGNRDCGPDACGGSCGTCPMGTSCNQWGICYQTCVPACQGKQCGSDGCGGICGTCAQSEACKQGQCVASTSCKELMECYWACPPGGRTCENQCWLNASQEARDQWMDMVWCLQDACGEDMPDQCVQQALSWGECKIYWDACQDCTPACAGKQCGADGCGGTCGTCQAGLACDSFGYCICQPQCTGKQCGSDGCGGSCGTCLTGHVCNWQGVCVCMPNCQNKECGSNGCGGSCGTCGPGATCTAQGVCQVTSYCGNGLCDSSLGEDCWSCPQDCGPCPGKCGDGWCDYDMGEDCWSCPMDCGMCPGECGDGMCDYDMGEDCWSCPMDCGTCPEMCGDGWCDIQMGESCWSCPDDCGPCNGYCGDGWCSAEAGESCESCPKDCGPCSTASCCSPHDSPGCGNAAVQSCTCAMDPYCCQVMWDDICVEGAKAYCGLTCGCQPQCVSADGQTKQCGPDGCGGLCGTCPSGQTCVNGKCSGGCIPNCSTPWGQVKQCGPNGCGGSCGICPPGSQCQLPQGICQGACVPNCAGKQCGPDGCGGSCGNCGPNAACVNGQCVGQGGKSCVEMIACAFNCNFQLNCVLQCSQGGSPTASAAFQDLSTCVAQVCGFTGITPACAEQAIDSSCNAQYNKCLQN